MMFPEKITGIKPHFRVLEVGPGGSPHPRSDVFLELDFDSDAEAIAQRGTTHEDPSLKARRVVYYSGRAFPFADKEFDYVICSHVIEHVHDVEFFATELSRVSRAGYVEFPTICYEYLYNFRVHVNIMANAHGELLYMRKSDTQLDTFYPINKFFYRTLELGATDLINSFKTHMCHGFEWTGSFRVRRVTSIAELVGPLPTELASGRHVPLHQRFLKVVFRRIGTLIGRN